MQNSMGTYAVWEDFGTHMILLILEIARTHVDIRILQHQVTYFIENFFFIRIVPKDIFCAEDILNVFFFVYT